MAKHYFFKQNHKQKDILTDNIFKTNTNMNIKTRTKARAGPRQKPNQDQDQRQGLCQIPRSGIKGQ